MSHNPLKLFNVKMNELLKHHKPHIAFGLAEPHDEILMSLKRGLTYANITLVGASMSKEVTGFDIMIDDEPEVNLATKLAQDD